MIEIMGLSQGTARRLIRLLAPALGMGRGTILDLAGPNPVWQSVLQMIMSELRTLITPDQAAAESWRAVQQLDRMQMVAWQRTAEQLHIEAARGVLERQVLEARAKEMAKYVRSIPEQLADDVGAQVFKAFGEGVSTLDLGELIAQRTGIAKNRARLIARDQLGSLNAELTQRRQVAAGVRRYKWQTARDERVRPSHRDLQGQIFSWDAPPDIGHPGQPIQCRCIAIPILDD